MSVIQVRDLLDSLIRSLMDHEQDEDTAYNKLIRASVDEFWLLHADKDVIRPGLRLLYTRYDTLDRLMMQVYKHVDTTIGGPDGRQILQAGSQRFDHLKALRDSTWQEITALTRISAASRRRGGAVRLITATAPIMAPAGWGYDGNDRRYRGDPYER